MINKQAWRSVVSIAVAVVGLCMCYIGKIINEEYAKNRVVSIIMDLGHREVIDRNKLSEYLTMSGESSLFIMANRVGEESQNGVYGDKLYLCGVVAVMLAVFALAVNYCTRMAAVKVESD